jgi:hypothetical protein
MSEFLIRVGVFDSDVLTIPTDIPKRVKDRGNLRDGSSYDCIVYAD